MPAVMTATVEQAALTHHLSRMSTAIMERTATVNTASPVISPRATASWPNACEIAAATDVTNPTSRCRSTVSVGPFCVSCSSGSSRVCDMVCLVYLSVAQLSSAWYAREFLMRPSSPPRGSSVNEVLSKVW